MTNAIEQSKREMYARLADLKQFVRASQFNMKEFEESMEKHLELLRQDHEALHETVRKRFEDIQSLEAVNNSLSAGNAWLNEQCAALTAKCDSLRNRMQAYEERESQASTSGQDSGDRATCATLDGKTAAILGVVVDVRQIVTDWGVGDLKAKKAMLKIAGIVNGPTCYSAMMQFEEPHTYSSWFLNNTECMHSFHRCPLSRDDKSEVCVFFGVGK